VDATTTATAECYTGKCYTDKTATAPDCDKAATATTAYAGSILCGWW
jgi:hypothetical protein